jgi:hypothetical protein
LKTSNQKLQSQTKETLLDHLVVEWRDEKKIIDTAKQAVLKQVETCYSLQVKNPA